MSVPVLLVVCIILGAGSIQETFSASSRKCTIRHIVGSVKIRRGKSVKWSAARLKMPLKEKDAIRTFMESEAELMTSEGTVIKVGENTTLEMSMLKGNEKEQTTSVKIMSGAVLANVKKLITTKSTFEFETPTATAAIRGTVVGLEVNKTRTRIKVYEGRVVVTPRGSKNSVELQQNQMGTVKKGVEKVAVEKFSETTPVLLSGTAQDTAVKDSVVDSTATGGTVDSAAVDTSDQSSTDPQDSVSSSLVLQVNAPAEGSSFAPSAAITVNGNISQASASISVNGKSAKVSSDGKFKTVISAPEQSGNMEITVSADLNGTSKTVVRTVRIKNENLMFTISSPADHQEFSKPLIPVSGTVTSGARVTVLSMDIKVTSNGTFSGQVPIANESGELILECEATLDGMSKNITRTIVYKPEYRFILSSPQERQTISTTALMIKGEVVPVNAEVTVLGKPLSVSSTGQFSGYITLPDEEGEIVLDFEITADGLSRTETRTVIYKKPPDTYRPQLAASIVKSCWNVTVFDRTEDEEITLWYEIDGSKEFKSLNPNESFCIPFENGIHSYRVYAQDKANNLSATEVLANHPFLANATWIIQMRKPAGNIALDIPPASPAGETSHFPLEFTIENLPDDDMQLIREIRVINKTNGRQITLKTFTDNFIETDIELVRQQSNLIQIDVHDINNIIKSHAVTINVR
jgi:hypothetical protein